MAECVVLALYELNVGFKALAKTESRFMHLPRRQGLTVQESIRVNASARWMLQPLFYDVRARDHYQVRHQGHPWRS